MKQYDAVFRYFSGTGNSWRVLDVCKTVFEKYSYSALNISITDEMAKSDWNAEFYGFCFPVYSLGLPRIAKKFLNGLPKLEREKRAFIFVTGGDPDNCGWSLAEGMKIMEGRGYKVTNTELFHMPDNWTVFLNPPSKEKASSMLEASEIKIKQSIELFLKDEPFLKPVVLKKFGYIPSRFLNFMFHNIGINRMWQFYKTEDNCSSCGLCEKMCPVGAVVLKDGRPKWNKNCEQCMRCVNYCPKKSIYQMAKIGGRNQYHEPHFKPTAG
jgi:NAD-dependent dihydropyrimidine dehydrogenase PreA subunit